MIKTTDILLEILLTLTFGILAIIIMTNAENIYIGVFMFLNILIYALLKFYLKRRKKTFPYVVQNFKQLGYDLIQERPLKLSEYDFESRSGNESEIKIEPTINNIPISRFKYVRKFDRIFKAKYMDDKVYELRTIVTKKWDGKIKIEIIDKNEC